MTQTADILLINAVVLTMDEKLALFEPGAVAVNGDSIVAVGPEAEIKTVFSAQEVVDCQKSAHARPDQRPYPCSDDAPPWSGR